MSSEGEVEFHDEEWDNDPDDDEVELDLFGEAVPKPPPGFRVATEDD